MAGRAASRARARPARASPMMQGPRAVVPSIARVAVSAHRSVPRRSAGGTQGRRRRTCARAARSPRSGCLPEGLPGTASTSRAPVPNGSRSPGNCSGRGCPCFDARHTVDRRRRRAHHAGHVEEQHPGLGNPRLLHTPDGVEQYLTHGPREAEHRGHSPRRDTPAYALADITSPTRPPTSGTQRHAHTTRARAARQLRSHAVGSRASLHTPRL
jgi:hypothetical protein